MYLNMLFQADPDGSATEARLWRAEQARTAERAEAERRKRAEALVVVEPGPSMQELGLRALMLVGKLTTPKHAPVEKPKSMAAIEREKQAQKDADMADFLARKEQRGDSPNVTLHVHEDEIAEPGENIQVGQIVRFEDDTFGEVIRKYGNGMLRIRQLSGVMW